MKLNFWSAIGTATLLAGNVLTNVQSAGAVGLSGSTTIGGQFIFATTITLFEDIHGNLGFTVLGPSSGSFSDIVPGTSGTVIPNPVGAGVLPVFAFPDGINFSTSSIGITIPSPGTTVTLLGGIFNKTGFDPSPGTIDLTTNATNPAPYTGVVQINNVPEPSDTAGIVFLGAVGGMFVVGNRKRLGFTAKS